MNLEDFKSFRRVLKPSEVGSIPTHSRHSRREPAGVVPIAAFAILAVFVVISVLSTVAVARAETQEFAPGEQWDGPGPFQRSMRSAVIPAWGQLTNGKNRKAALFFSAQAYIYTRIVLETRKARAADREALRLEAQGADLFEIGLAETSAANHFDRRREMVFWALVGSFFGAIDAYIDAHFGDFEKDLEEGRELFVAVDPTDSSVEVGLRF